MAEMQRKQRRASADLSHLQQMLALSGWSTETKEPLHLTFKRKARALFDEEERKVSEVRQSTLAFLKAGALLTSLTDPSNKSRFASLFSGGECAYHLYMTHDEKFIQWRKGNGKGHRMHVSKIVVVSPDASTQMGKRCDKFGDLIYPADRVFSMFGSIAGANDQDMTQIGIDWVCRSRTERDEWVTALQEVVDYAKSLRMFGESHVTMHDNELMDHTTVAYEYLQDFELVLDDPE